MTTAFGCSHCTALGDDNKQQPQTASARTECCQSTVGVQNVKRYLTVTPDVVRKVTVRINDIDNQPDSRRSVPSSPLFCCGFPQASSTAN